jgi:hypothetical protein
MSCKHDLTGYTRFPKANGGGVWIKNEGKERKGMSAGALSVKQICCLDCKKPKKNPNMSRVQKWVRVYRINPKYKKAVEKALAEKKGKK